MKKLILISCIVQLLQSCGPSACECAEMTREGYIGSSDFDWEITKNSNCRKKFGNDWGAISRKKCDD
jgi:hypothetical protein